MTTTPQEPTNPGEDPGVDPPMDDPSDAPEPGTTETQNSETGVPDNPARQPGDAPMPDDPNATADHQVLLGDDADPDPGASAG